MASKTDTIAGLLQKVADEGQKLTLVERRNFLKNGLMLAGNAMVGGAIARKAS